MAIHILKDVDETLDYVFVKQSPEDIVSVSYSVDQSASISVISCNVNGETLVDFSGKTYPPSRAIVLWVSGGTHNTNDIVNITYQTEFGRIFDERVVFTLLQND